MIDFDIKLGWDVPARTVWGYHKDSDSHVRIFLCRGVCDYCKMDLLDEYDYMHMLEHEVFEGVVCVTAASDGLDPRNWKGFNKVYSPMHYRTKWHMCEYKDTSVMVRIG
jgi:hypothetical protein